MLSTPVSGESRRVMDAGQPRPHDQAGTKPRRRQRWGVERARQRNPPSVPGDQGRHPSCDAASPLTKPLDAHTGTALPHVTTGAGPWRLATSVSPLVTATPGVGSYQEMSMAEKSFTTVPVGGNMTAPP